MKKKLISVLALLLVAVFLLSGSAAHGKTLMEAGKEEISVNIFQLYLSRMKWSLSAAGDDINSDAYWATFINTDNVTQAQYYTNQVFEGLRQIAAALILYEELGLQLSDAEEDAIDAYIDELIEEVGGGSKSQLNSVLSAYGANVTVLKDAYIIEAKMAQLKQHIYGENGALIAATAKEELYRSMYYRGKQMLIANYYYDHAKDADGLSVVYKTDAKGNFLLDAAGNLIIAYDTTATPETDGNGNTVYRKFGDIAYDKKNGTVAYDRDASGNQIKRRDVDGNVVYILEDGSVAYDKAKGRETTDKDGKPVWRLWVAAYDTDGKCVADGEKVSLKYVDELKNGETKRKIAYYSTEEMEKRYLLAQQIAKECSESNNGEAIFGEYQKLGDNVAFNDQFAPNGMYFAQGSAMSDALFGTMASELYKMEIGETAVLESDSGYYVLMRCALNDGAWGAEANKTWFESFNELLVEHMLQNKLKAEGYLDRVVVDEELKKTVDITMVAANNYY